MFTTKADRAGKLVHRLLQYRVYKVDLRKMFAWFLVQWVVGAEHLKGYFPNVSECFIGPK